MYQALGAKLVVGMPFKDIATSDSIFLRELPAHDNAKGQRALRRLQVRFSPVLHNLRWWWDVIKPIRWFSLFSLASILCRKRWLEFMDKTSMIDHMERSIPSSPTFTIFLTLSGFTLYFPERFHWLIKIVYINAKTFDHFSKIELRLLIIYNVSFTKIHH